MQPVERYEFDVFYRQFAVHRTGDDAPFPMWTDAHVQQAFAWRPESVGFGTLVDGPHAVEVRVVSEEESVNAVRIIDVPFDAPERDTVLIEAIFGSDLRLAIPPGAYTLRAKFVAPAGDKARVRLTFTARSGAGRFE